MQLVNQKAIVKCVLSGDTVVIRGKPVNGPPPEKIVSLSYLTVPKFSLKASEANEPLGFEAREYLRKTLVAKEIDFVVDNLAPSGREYISIPFEGKLIQEELLLRGLAKLRPNAVNVPESLIVAEQMAKSEGAGLWSEDLPQAVSVMDLNSASSDKVGKTLKGVIEQVRDASTLRVVLTDGPTMELITVFVSGIRAPSKDEEFADEARFFVESRLLQQEIELIIEGIASNSAVYVASIKHPKGNIAQALVSNGLAKVSDYSVASVTGGPLQLREAERKAQAARLRLWKNFVAPQQQKGSSFNGTVTKIMSGDTIVVERDSDGQELKVTLSSIRQPRVKEEGFYQMEAKEYLRSKLIGKKVSVNLEYKKAATGDFEERSCGSVFLGSMNIAEALLNKGLAYVIFHKKDDLERSKHYDLYLVAHDKAQKENKGVHSGKEVAPLRIVDASENATKARSFLPSLKRAGKVSAVVEHVMSGNRFKLLVKKDSTKLSFLLGDVRTPRLGKPGSSQKSEPFAEEALRFVQRIVYQRDVEVEIENIDKSGVFIGSLFINGTNLALLLVQDGLAFVSNNVSRDYAKQLTDAESNAQSKDIKIWKLRNQELRKQEELEAKALPESNAFEIVVSEISAGDTFFYQEVAQGNKLVELMDNLNRSELKALFNSLKIGDLVAAQFSEDKAWYRAKVRKVLEGGSKYEVFYIDYGNSEVLPKSSLRVLDTVFAAVSGQAKEGKLAFVKSPPVTEEYGSEAAQVLSRLLSSSPTIKAKGIIRDGAVSYLLLLDPSSEASKQNLSMEKALSSSYNKEMLRLGYAQMGVIGKRFPEVQKILTPFFEEAKSERRGMYEYGDYSLDEDPAL